MKIANAYSLGMLQDSMEGANLSVQKISKETAANMLKEGGVESAVGHADTAAVLSSELGVEVPMNRMNLKLNFGDQLIVAQLTGGRLPEGTKTLPPGTSFVYYLITVSEPKVTAGFTNRFTRIASDNGLLVKLLDLLPEMAKKLAEDGDNRFFEYRLDKMYPEFLEIFNKSPNNDFFDYRKEDEKVTAGLVMKKLVRIANKLDKAGLYKFADEVDAVAKEVVDSKPKYKLFHADHGITEQQLDYIVSQLPKEDGFFIREVKLPSGTVRCGLHGPAMGDAPVPRSEVEMKKRSSDRPADPICKRPYRQVDYVQAIGSRSGDEVTLYTVYGGPLAPQNPKDPNCSDVAAAEEFWSTHALSE